MTELSAKGVTFPVTIDYYIKAGAETAMDNAACQKECPYHYPLGR